MSFQEASSMLSSIVIDSCKDVVNKRCSDPGKEQNIFFVRYVRLPLIPGVTVLPPFNPSPSYVSSSSHFSAISELPVQNIFRK